MTGSNNVPHWRSIMFVPVTVERFVEKAHLHGADALLLDLEDSVAPAEKEAARGKLDNAIRTAMRGRSDIGVRINRPLDLMVRDVEAAVQPGVSFLALPKVEGALHVKLISELVSELEARRGLSRGQIRFVVNIETASTFSKMEEIGRADPRVVGLALGSEDFCSSCDIEPSLEALFMPKQMSVLAACAAGILPIGFIGSVANFTDNEGFRSVIQRSKALGFRCGYAIHPDQVKILNAEFGPSMAEIEHAKGVLDAAQQALRQNTGAVAYKGKMIDKPMFDRAQRLLARAEAISALEQPN